MSLIVQKFGGTSVADSEKIMAAARKAVRAHQAGHRVVLVVSAMGKNTDLLEKLAWEVNPCPPAREMDMLLSTGEQVSVALMAMAIDSLGCKATSLTGGQVGIKTDSSHQQARIQSIATDRIVELMNQGNIVIAAGFQGIDEQLNITTLGRGGSDTTAVALAAVLNADRCEIYTDVDGIYTTDPRLLPEKARLISQVSYDEMLELASLGAGVMHSRSIEFGKKFNVAIQVRNSGSDALGSLIVDSGIKSDLPVSGVAVTRNEARISLLDVPDVPGTILKIVEPLAQQQITVDMIVQNIADAGLTDISFTVAGSEVDQASKILSGSIEELGGRLGSIDLDVAKVSAVGVGMNSHPDVAGRMFQSLANAGVNIQMISTGDIKISALVLGDQAIKALETTHDAFGLDAAAEGTCGVRSLDLANRAARPVTEKADEMRSLAVVRRLQQVGMESLIIDAVNLDDTQSRITLVRVPNQPGIAATIFERIAAKKIFVDMIVQSYAHDEFADISFTVPRVDFEKAAEVASELQQILQCEEVKTQPSCCKLSVTGVGLRSHATVALQTFQVLSNANINIEMVSTSEVSLNVAVPEHQSALALELLNSHFKCDSSKQLQSSGD